MVTIYANKVNELTKVYNRYAKKANAVGLNPTITIGEPYPKKIDVYENDHINHVTVKTGYTVIEVVDVEINFPTYKLGEYTVIAVLEHGNDNKNLVYPCGDYEVPKHYFTAKGICEHCNTNHKRVKTIVLKDKNNNYKQVGKACLKEYTGVEDYNIASAYEALNCIIEDSNANYGWYSEAPVNTKYTETVDYLAKCIHYIKKNGYLKDKTKYEACEFDYTDLTTADYNDADAVIDFFKNYNANNDTFLNNIKVAVTNEYTRKVNGFVAYAYIAWQKEVERIAREAKKAEEAQTVEYFGEVGDKFTVEVTGRIITGYATMYGWTNIIEFKDNNNHVFIWRTGKDIDVDDNGIWTGTLRGTVKEHSEYGGIKQTVVTRCKVG